MSVSIASQLTVGTHKLFSTQLLKEVDNRKAIFKLVESVLNCLNTVWLSSGLPSLSGRVARATKSIANTCKFFDLTKIFVTTGKVKGNPNLLVNWVDFSKDLVVPLEVLMKRDIISLGSAGDFLLNPLQNLQGDGVVCTWARGVGSVGRWATIVSLALKTKNVATRVFQDGLAAAFSGATSLKDWLQLSAMVSAIGLLAFGNLMLPSVSCTIGVFSAFTNVTWRCL